MADRVVLHVGLMKSGTTYLQGLLFANRERLAQQGIVVPFRAWSKQLFAVRDLIGRPEGARGTEGMWPELVSRVAKAEGTVVVSVERFGIVAAEFAEQAVRTFQEQGAEVEVVITARDLNRSLGSLWQESIQNGHTWRWPEYVAGAGRARPGGPPTIGGPKGHHFWTQMNLFRIANKWARYVGPDNVTVVTVPRKSAGPDELLRRFAQAVGFDPSDLAPGPSENSGCGVASLEVLRRLNVELDARGLAFPAGVVPRKSVLAKQVLGPRRKQEGKVGHPAVSWVPAESERIRRKLGERGVRLLGEWADLDPLVVDGADPEAVPDADLLAAALAGLDGLHAWYAAGPGANGGPDVKDPQTDRPIAVDAAVAALADLVQAAIEAEKGVRR